MKKYFFLPLLAVFFTVSCNNSESTTGNDNDSVSVEKPGVSYAEISVKEGGEWQERKYIGGSAFKNIEKLRVPDEHTDHSYYIRYEGPGWESDKVGYRIYLDWRNAIDIFGKVTDSIILPQVGQDGFDSYHEMCSWGTDILKVGKALGIGSVGRYLEDSVHHFQIVDSTLVDIINTKEKSSVKINYYGWGANDVKVNLESILSIAPNQRYTKHQVTSSDAVEGICTGIVRHGVDVLKKESENKKWGYLATYGVQTLVPDKLGMAVFYKTDDVETVTDAQFDHLIVFKPTKEQITYYFLGAWEQEKDGIKTKEEFVKYLDSLLAELNEKDNI